MNTKSKTLENTGSIPKNLNVREVANDLTSQIYNVTNYFPEKEQFRLVSQMRSTALYVSGNIIEGKSRKSQKELSHFFNIARESVDKLNYFLQLSKGLNYLNSDQYEALNDKCSHIGSMLNNLTNRNITSLN